MRRFVSSLFDFTKALFVPAASFAAAIDDPLRWLKGAGLVSGDLDWIFPDYWRQIGLVTFGFVWLFIWYYRQRIAFEDRKPAVPDMPLHEAARHIARDSVWAANYPAQLDDQWITRVDQELMSKLMMGHVRAFGIYKPDGDVSVMGTKEIPLGFFDHAEWYSSHLCTQEPPSHMWRSSQHGGGVYRRVKLNRRQVEDAWPHRSLLQRLRRRSPVERIGYDATFRQQDEHYRQLEAGTHGLNAIDELLGERRKQGG